MKDQILERIDRDGPMRFDTYMELSLYDADEGFFTAGSPRAGTDGDFLTSPEVSPWFGRLIGRWARSVAQPGNAVLVEVGAGTGSLLQPLVEDSGEWFERYEAVEIAQGGRDRLAERGLGVGLGPDLPIVAEGTGVVVVANELLDNLPSRLVERTADGWMEMCLVGEGGRFELVPVLADAELASWCDHYLGDAPVGPLLAAQQRIVDWLFDVLDTYRHVEILLIDYAARTTQLATRKRDEVVRGFRGHRGVELPDEPGSTDVTVEVNLDVLETAAHERGCDVEISSQRDFLDAWGASGAIDDLVQQEYSRAQHGDVVGQLRARSEATALRALRDPSGFGGFWVIRIASGTNGAPASVKGPQDRRMP